MIITDATRLPRLMQCLGSHYMPVPVVAADDDTTDRDEGNAAHFMAQVAFGGTPLDDLIGQRAYNGIIMDAEMASHVRRYLESLDCGAMEVATTITTDRWIINARADHIVFRDGHLTVDDFKYGYRLVMPDMNWTLIAHAVGYCIENNVQPHTITLRIHQPRRYHPDGPLREWSFDYATLCAFYQQIDERLSSGGKMLQTGTFCPTCPAAATCPAFRDASMNALDVCSRLYSDDLPNPLLASELDLLTQAQTIIEGRLTAMQGLAKHKIAQGEVVPMYGLEQQYANRKFKKGITAAAIRVLTGKDAAVEKTVTPAELARRGVNEDILALLTERPMTGVKLVRGDPDARARRLLRKGK